MINFFKNRKFRQGSVATIITVLVVAVIVVFNMLVGAISDKFSLSLDLTGNKLFAVSDQTKTYLADLQKDVTIYVLNSEADFAAAYLQANEILHKYAPLSPHIKLEYVDIVRNPTFAGKYPDLQLGEGTILITCGEKAKTLSIYDLYTQQTDYQTGATKYMFTAEQNLTKTILSVTSDKQYGVVMLSGHGEATEGTMDALTAMLEDNDFAISTQDLLTKGIDPEASVAVISAPAKDYSPADLKQLDTFLNLPNKTLIYFAATNQPDLPNLQAFLADWGIGVDSGTVLENDQNNLVFTGQGYDPSMTIAVYKEDVYAKPALAKNMRTIIPLSRPLSVLFETKSAIEVTAPLAFSETCLVYPQDAAADWQPTQADFKGEIPALIVAKRSSYEGSTLLTSSVVACGSYLAVDESLLKATSYANGSYFMNLFGTLAQRETVVDIQAKDLSTAAQLGLNAFQAILFGLIFIVLLPLAVVIWGFVVFLRRRHR